MSHERRTSERVSLEQQIQIRFSTAEAALTSTLLDMSQRGLFVESATPHPIGTAFHVSLVFERPSVHFDLKGTVVRIQDGTGGKPGGMGIHLADPPVVWDRFYAFLLAERDHSAGVTVLR